MGAYLNKPIKEKESEEGGNGKVKYGATSMQGWRVNQEDAHNCVLDLTNEWHLFAVYDGHGGSEVSKYTSQHLPNFIKSTEVMSKEDMANAIAKLFIDFDDKLRSEEVMKELNGIANEGKPKRDNAGGDSDDDEDDRIQTIEESNIPLEELLARYGCTIVRGGPNSKIVSGIVDAANAVKDASESEDDKEKEPKKRLCKSPTGAEEEAKRPKTEDGDVDSSEAPTPKTKSRKADKKTENADSEQVEHEDSESDEDFDENQVEEEEEDDEDEEEGDEEMEEDELLIPGGGDTPGEDSGTTACVCFLGERKIVVANIGDSRAVLSRAGKAVDLSVDHKPEDDIEKTRIENAGGVVSEEGRVNGGLNLSRAFGDHCYKKNEKLSLGEQMISALPDVRIENLAPEDEFLVVACDGIWNSMESQEVIDFVRVRLQKGETPKAVAEQLCDNCLADSTAGDGTGCDNMTVIVATINNS